MLAKQQSLKLLPPLFDATVLYLWRVVMLYPYPPQPGLAKGEKLFIPDSELSLGSGNLRQQCVEIAHEAHQGETKTKKLLRAKIWFP